MTRYLLLCTLAVIAMAVNAVATEDMDMSAKADTVTFWDSGRGEFQFPSAGNEFIVWEKFPDDPGERYSIVYGVVTLETTIRIRNSSGVISQEDLKILSGDDVFVSGEFQRIDEYGGEGSRTLCLSMEVTVLGSRKK